MPLFFHDICEFGDAEGFGVLIGEHYDEHLQFISVGQQQSPLVQIPDYDLGAWSGETSFIEQWLNVHEDVHTALRNWTGVAGINLADVDFGKEDEFYQWLDAHRAEHALIRQVLGLT